MKRLLIPFIFILPIIIAACSSPQKQTGSEKFSEIWKASTPEERGYIAFLELISANLEGQDKKKVEDFLGPPDNIEGKHYLYDLGKMGGPYRWTMYVTFDETGKVIEVTGDD